MVVEQKKIRIRKFFWLVAVVVCIIPFLYSIGQTGEAKFIKDEWFTEFSVREDGGEVYGSNCTLVLTYGKELAANECEVEIVFYDVNGVKLEEQWSPWGNLGKDGKQITYEFYVGGEVDSFQIVYEYATYKIVQIVRTLSGILGFIVVLIFLSVIFHKGKRFTYGGREIIVYTGWRSYIKVDGVLQDKSIDVFNNHLSCTLEGGLSITVDISAFHKLKIKINDKLYTP